MKITVNVTQEDIEAVVAGSRCECPVARAIERATPGASEVSVTADSVMLYPRLDNTDPSLRTLPLDVCRFVEAFDDRRPVAPMTFDLDVPEWALKEAKP